MDGDIPATGLDLLVVDDDTATTDTSARFFALSGHRVLRAYDGLSALSLAEHHRLDAVLLDMEMPGMDGLEVTRRLRQLPQLEETFVLGISGHATEQIAAQALKAGCDDYLIKPVDPIALNQLLATFAELRSQLQSRLQASQWLVQQCCQQHQELAEVVRSTRALMRRSQELRRTRDRPGSHRSTS
jgi:CheY-like chemotaxis protein